MNKLKIALVQARASAIIAEQNAKAAVRRIEEAKAGGADLVLFPECFLHAYTFPPCCDPLPPLEAIENDPEFLLWKDAALTDERPVLKMIREAAKRNAIGVVMTAFTKGKDRPRNTAYLIGRDGSILLKYSKVHTCDFSVERYIESGDGFYVQDFDGVKIGLMICYDREYPESARELALQGAELILVPNDCPDQKPFRLRELSVEAMQNMVGIAMTNPPFQNETGGGCSCAYSPICWGREDNAILIADETTEGIFYAEFDMDEIRDYRKRQDLGKYRKTYAYRSLLKN
ncbi:MAG: carbon-nitrogen hydrolase family protein [Bacteroides sp.]|nr:carbon-nitrogen hydrolase family protein [Eubacterium sp.]MCM1417478.1 carbon-nitrogen hydrolase family protein [Roseburia sp.]MCM1461658.1 carbon-nitrogen hydrolase family protein [Bacteroides sp.]